MTLNHKEKMDHVFESSEYLSNLLVRYSIIEARYMPINNDSTGAEDIVYKIYTAPSETLSELKRIIVDVYMRILEYAGEVRNYHEKGKFGMAKVFSDLS
jgi:hypothetical protein